MDRNDRKGNRRTNRVRERQPGRPIKIAVSYTHLDVYKRQHVLCVDGTVIPYSEYEQSKEQAIAVVFHIGSE